MQAKPIAPFQQRQHAGQIGKAGGPAPARQLAPDRDKGFRAADNAAIRQAHMHACQGILSTETRWHGRVFIREIDERQSAGVIDLPVVLNFSPAQRACTVKEYGCA